MKNILLRLDRELSMLDSAQMKIRVKGTFLHQEISQLLKGSSLTSTLKKQRNL